MAVVVYFTIYSSSGIFILLAFISFFFKPYFRYISKKCNIMKKVNIFCHSFQKVKHILYRFITQSEIFQAFISWHVDDYGLQIMKTQNSVSSKFEYYIGYFKQKCHASEKYVHFYTLNTWLGLLLHELLHQCGVAWRQSACDTAQV